VTATLQDAFALHQAGRLDEADAIYAELIAADPNAIDALNLSGQIDLAHRRFDAALAKFVRARSLAPGFADAWMNEGNALRGAGRPAEALAALEQAARLAPQHALILCNRGLAKLDLGDADGAVADIAAADAAMPGVKALRENLGVALKAANRPMAALAVFAASDSPAPAASVRQDLLDHAGAMADYATALAREPGRPDVESNRLFTANYDPAMDSGAIKALYAAWGSARARQPIAATPDFSPARRVRIGFVSGELRRHSARHFLWPLLEHFPRDGAALVAFATDPGADDDWTRRYRGAFDEWHAIGELDDDAAAAFIAAAKIDVLVDLSGHSQGNRLGVFARKAAPVQATWLGYGGTTGLAAIDWYIGDERLVPPGAESAFVERVWRLPHTAFVYAPQDAMPACGPAPMLRNGYPTFGCFSRTVRYNARCLALWARVLAAIPKARLVLNALVFGEGETRDLFRHRFAEWGGDASRLDLIATAPQPVTWAAYGAIDIALDPFPHNAGATTFEALWMGVPVLSKRDRAPLGRFGDSILGACGLGDWVVDGDDAFVARAIAAVADPAALNALRQGMRARVAGSALGDAQAYARDFAAALRGMWRMKCEERA
jgi:predicted O-linked N-acetylglucosamine transferase (SPINDLY family)